MIKQKILKINKIVKTVCFHVIPYIHSLVKGFFRTYQWRPKSIKIFLKKKKSKSEIIAVYDHIDNFSEDEKKASLV